MFQRGSERGKEISAGTTRGKDMAVDYGEGKWIVMPVGRAVDTTPSLIYFKKTPGSHAALLGQKRQAGDACVIKHSELAMGDMGNTYQTKPPKGR